MVKIEGKGCFTFQFLLHLVWGKADTIGSKWWNVQSPSLSSQCHERHVSKVEDNCAYLI